MEPSDEIRELVQQYYAAARDGYTAAAAGFISDHDGVVVIGTDPMEWWDGAGYNRAMRAQSEAMGGSIPIYEGDIQTFQEGSVAWVIDQPTFRFSDDAEAQARMTAILHLEDGEWKLVHAHVSIGVPNEEALGEELPV